MSMLCQYRIIDDFLAADVAQALRGGIEQHFRHPERHTAAEHQVWNFWHVPGLYTYLRTTPERVLPREPLDDFVASLRAWAMHTLGLDIVTWPYLSLYVNGCRQGVHNDAANGRFGYVYSLTKDARRSLGGETLLFRKGDLFEMYATRPASGSDFHAVVEPRFNRLLAFDDRLPHAVEVVQGPMDPLEGRFVLHGHLS